MILEYFLKDHTTKIEKARSSLFLGEDNYVYFAVYKLIMIYVATKHKLWYKVESST